MVKRIALIGLLFYCQMPVWCQPADQLASLANSYFKTWPEPNLMLVFNQPKYIAGDTIYFKAFYRVNPIESLPDELVNVNLIDFNGQPIANVIFPLRNGTGYSQLILPDTLQAGIYMITAQTNWMRNFNKLFTQVVPVVTDKQVNAKASEEVMLRAEGGKLIADLPNRIGINTAFGKRMFEIVDEQGGVVAKHITNQWGTALVTLTPIQARYYFRWVNDGNLQNLPDVVPQGVTVQLDQTDLVVKVAINRSRYIPTEPLAVLITGRGKVHYTNEIQASSGVMTLAIDVTKFPPGVMQISILNRSGTLVANRDFYVPQSHDVKISLSKQQVKPREEVVVKFNKPENPAGTWLLRATNQQVFPTADWPHLDWIKNGFASPFPTDSIALQHIDQWLVTASEELPWKAIQNPDKNRKRYPPLNIIERSGIVKDTLTGNAVPSGTQIMFLLQQKKFTYQTFTSNENGFVSLTIPDLIAIDELFYVAEYKGKRIPVQIEWMEMETNWPTPPAFALSDSTDLYGTFKQHVKRINHSYQTFLNQPIRDTLTSPEDETDTWLGRSDSKVLAEKFIAFATMQEFVREVVPSLTLGTNRSGTWVRVGLTARQATEDPVYIIDGQATLRTDFFLALKPSDIRSILIYNTQPKLIRLGLLGKHGVVVVNTKSGSWRPPDTDLSLTIQGVVKPILNSNVIINHLAPVFRSTVSWNPQGGSIQTLQAADDLCSVRVEGFGLQSGEVVYVASEFGISLK
ncbi:MAG: hypothetical protein J0L67_10985 [Cytophagales bacterium]|nr:hypothetical protein [Cytophagales bacterium]